MNKAIFLDRDNTLNYDEGYTYKIEQLKFLPGAIEGLKKLSRYKLFIVTDQSGIGRGYYSEEDFHKFMDNMIEVLKDNGIKIEKYYYCPHKPEDKCDCRKPSIKFIKEAEKEYKLDLKNSYVVGDKEKDVELGKKAGCKTIWIGKDAKNLNEAAELILNDNKKL